ncbi:MAG: hypothetical protein GF309_08465 [Candidatus Lokiarchaeota archaeon]|nr:hypothetical protein [Candidatus Lokiarchaeota archaeon]
MGQSKWHDEAHHPNQIRKIEGQGYQPQISLSVAYAVLMTNVLILLRCLEIRSICIIDLETRLSI